MRFLETRCKSRFLFPKLQLSEIKKCLLYPIERLGIADKSLTVIVICGAESKEINVFFFGLTPVARANSRYFVKNLKKQRAIICGYLNFHTFALSNSVCSSVGRAADS